MVHFLFSHITKRLLRFLTGEMYWLMSTMIFSMKLQELRVSSEELTINIGIPMLPHTLLKVWQLSYQDILEVFTIGITLVISQLQMLTEIVKMLSLELNQDSLFLVNGRLTGVKAIAHPLDIICSRMLHKPLDIFLTIPLFLISMIS